MATLTEMSAVPQASAAHQSLHHDHFCVNSRFPGVELWLVSSSITCSRGERLRISGAGFVQVGCPSCHAANSVAALNETSPLRNDRRTCTGALTS